jgi:anthranilate synthase/aminodeoxychorismate synthase-like glutamine amidotransferase
MTILLLDNYDSFTYNLAQHLGERADVDVRRNDELSLDAIRRKRYHGIVVSPGPGHPANPKDFGVCTRVLLELSPKVPTLGVCLGHQGIVNAYGGRVVHARKVIHGKTSLVHHDGRGVFKGVPDPVTVVRYHSLIAERASVPDCLKVTATDRGEIMGVRHTTFPIEGVQFHPESIGTEAGHRMIDNFVARTRSQA